MPMMHASSPWPRGAACIRAYRPAATSTTSPTGVGYHDFHSQLAVGLANDIFLDARELTVAYGGIGLQYGWSPLDTYRDMSNL